MASESYGVPMCPAQFLRHRKRATRYAGSPLLRPGKGQGYRQVNDGSGKRARISQAATSMSFPLFDHRDFAGSGRLGVTVERPGPAVMEERMTQANYARRVQASIKADAERLAKAEGTTLNQFINVAVAEKIAALGTADFFRERARRAKDLTRNNCVKVVLVALERWCSSSRPGRYGAEC